MIVPAEECLNATLQEIYSSTTVSSSTLKYHFELKSVITAKQTNTAYTHIWGVVLS